MLLTKEKAIKKYIYYVYIVQSRKSAKNVKYPMGILWLCYGYPMVPPRKRPEREWKEKGSDGKKGGG